MSGSFGPPCPACGHGRSVTLDSRPTEAGHHRRRKKCVSCGHRFTTYETTSRPGTNPVAYARALRRLSGEVEDLARRLEQEE